MAEQDIEDRKILSEERNNLSKVLVSYSIIAIIVLLAFAFGFVIVTTFALGDKDTRVDKVIGIADKIISSFFPLVGAWVGAVVAFYFSRDNFIVATQSAQALLRKEAVDPLSGKTVQSAMLPIARATVLKAADGALKATTLKALLDQMKTAGVMRLPLLLDDDKPFAVLHWARVKEFLDNKVAADQQDAATVQTMIDDQEYARWLPGSFALAAPATSLAEAWAVIQMQKLRMGRLGCMDILVTTNGKADEKVVGYLTNDAIDRERAAATQ